MLGILILMLVFVSACSSRAQFLDGIGIGLGFQISNVVGVLVAVAVISHDFTDGMNTISFYVEEQEYYKEVHCLFSY